MQCMDVAELIYFSLSIKISSSISSRAVQIELFQADYFADILSALQTENCHCCAATELMGFGVAIVLNVSPVITNC